MTSHAKVAHDQDKVQIHYQLIRNVTAPEEKDSGVQTYFANVSAEHIVDLGTDKNLRDYIPSVANKKRNSVHKAIENTILVEPARFINRNSGLTVTCSDIVIDDKKKIATLTDPSVINGAQTKGEILRYLESISDEDDDYWPDAGFHVRVEINVDSDDGSVVETAIARNTSTGVQSISQAGARGHLNDLNERMLKKLKMGIRLSETDTNVAETFQILQYTRLLMPTDLRPSSSATEMLRPYKQKSKCLEDFSNWYLNKDTDETAKKRYDFVVAMAPIAWQEYSRWESHQGWNGHRLWEETKKGGRACRRDANDKIIWVSPGILFPLMNALSAFVEQNDDGEWGINKPALFKPDDLIRRTVAQFRAHESSPMDMGRSEGAYEALLTYPQTIADVMKAFKEA